jgi:hypothetical protein
MYFKLAYYGENLLRCTTKDKKDLIFITNFFLYILIPSNLMS